MKIRVALVVLAALALALLPAARLPVRADTPPVVVVKGGEQRATATFDSSLGAVARRVTVTARVFVTPPLAGSDVTVNVTYTYNGKRVAHYAGTAQLEPDQFQLQGPAALEIGPASLRADVRVCGDAGQARAPRCFPLSLDLRWTGAGRTVSASSVSLPPEGPDCRVVPDSTTYDREASASGSIARGGQELAPRASSVGHLYRDDSVTTYIGNCPIP